MKFFNLYLFSSCLVIPFSQLWAVAGLYHEAPCRNLIFSGTCLSQGDSGLPLRGNRNDSFGVATCCALADWLKKCNIAELNG